VPPEINTESFCLCRHYPKDKNGIGKQVNYSALFYF